MNPKSIGRNLRAARVRAGLSETELAAKLIGVSEFVRRVEDGEISVSEHYVARVLEACGLPPDWKAP